MRLCQTLCVSRWVSGFLDLLIYAMTGLTQQEGDLILTGTPAGVSEIKAGEKFEAKLTYPGLEGEELSSFSFDVVDRKGPYEFKA